MHDLKWIRENSAAFDAALARRGLPPQAEAIIELDARRRAAQTTFQELQARRNEASKQIGILKKDGKNADELMAEVATLKDSIPAAEEEDRALGARIEAALSIIPNLPAADVPQGADENDNVEIKRWGDIPKFAFTPQPHEAIGAKLGMMDFEAAAKLSGARFVVLRGALARMERALAAFMLDYHTLENGYTEVASPVLVKEDALYGTGQLPKFAEDLFRTTGSHWLIPTAEVTLTNLVADSILDETALPIRMTAQTACFRSEAGSAGRDTTGMIRQHQFQKVEMVSIAHPDQSAEEHERMTRGAETILERLGLAYRRILLCTGDMGFSSNKTFDLEVWFPSQDRYREISSCSNCGEFQARRMKARFKGAGDKNTRHVHTLNGSGLAVGRTMIAIMENYQQADGSVVIPEALRPYMGGLTVIAP